MDKVSLLARVERASQRWDHVNSQELEHLARALGQMPSTECFEALLHVFTESPSGAYLQQEYAGQLLLRLKPECARPLDEVLKLVLPKWNRSIDQFPVYLVELFGREKVSRSLQLLDQASAVDREITDSVRFWLKAT